MIFQVFGIEQGPIMVSAQFNFFFFYQFDYFFFVPRSWQDEKHLS